MANQHYKIINTTSLELDGREYMVQNTNLNLEEFLKENYGKELYIYAPSITTDDINAIVK
jgi:hypothetical protein